MNTQHDGDKMNFCTKCESLYTKPGTCNCYAETRPSDNRTFYPWLPPYPYQPTYPWRPWDGTTTGNLEVTWGTNSGNADTTVVGSCWSTTDKDVPYTLTTTAPGDTQTWVPA